MIGGESIGWKLKWRKRAAKKSVNCTKSYSPLAICLLTLLHCLAFWIDIKGCTGACDFRQSASSRREGARTLCEDEVFIFCINMLSNLLRSTKSSTLRSACKAATCTKQVRFQSSDVKDHMGTYDNAYDDYQVAKGESRRAFTYLTLGGARFLYATGARLAAMKFVSSISASADVLALAAMEVDVTKINPGSTITVKWRGKPVFIRNRTAEEIAEAEECDLGELRDVETDAERLADATKPEWLVVLGVCTHLGCVPLPNQGNYKGWFCPCHGSHYDTSGRIRKGPAPLNLEVPPWSFVSDAIIKLG